MQHFSQCKKLNDCKNVPTLQQQSIISYEITTSHEPINFSALMLPVYHFVKQLTKNLNSNRTLLKTATLIH